MHSRQRQMHELELQQQQQQQQQQEEGPAHRACCWPSCPSAALHSGAVAAARESQLAAHCRCVCVPPGGTAANLSLSLSLPSPLRCHCHCRSSSTSRFSTPSPCADNASSISPRRSTPLLTSLVNAAAPPCSTLLNPARALLLGRTRGASGQAGHGGHLSDRVFVAELDDFHRCRGQNVAVTAGHCALYSTTTTSAAAAAVAAVMLSRRVLRCSGSGGSGWSRTSSISAAATPAPAAAAVEGLAEGTEVGSGEGAGGGRVSRIGKCGPSFGQSLELSTITMKILAQT